VWLKASLSFPLSLSLPLFLLSLCRKLGSISWMSLKELVQLTLSLLLPLLMEIKKYPVARQTMCNSRYNVYTCNYYTIVHCVRVCTTLIILVVDVKTSNENYVCMQMNYTLPLPLLHPLPL
jgi:hypothetical protein